MEKKELKLTFNGLTELENYLDIDRPPFNPECYSRTYDEPDYCPDNWSQCIKFLQNGYPKGTAAVNKFYERMITGTDFLRKVKKVIPAKRGQKINIAKFLTGDPNCMLKRTGMNVKRETVRIIINASTPSDTPPEQIQRRGAAILTIIDRLLENDYNVEVSITKYSQGEMQKGINCCDLRLNVTMTDGYSRDLLSFCLCHAGFLRRIMFYVIEKLTNQTHVPAGYGSRKEFDPDIEAEIKFEALWRQGAPWDTDENAIEEVKRIYAEAVKIKEEGE